MEKDLKVFPVYFSGPNKIIEQNIGLWIPPERFPSKFHLCLKIITFQGCLAPKVSKSTEMLTMG